jgi:sporulation protein YlmC with PRC-barrel domain
MAGRVLEAAFELLDRELIDCDGKEAGTVDDVELAWPPGGGPPYVTAILAGPGALARRLGGRLGEWVASVHRRLNPDDGDPARIPFGVVKRIGSAIELSVPRRDLPITRFEDWVRDHIISKIPGADRATE